MRRQSECQDPPRKKEEDFRNRSQSLDGGVRYPNLRDADCETTYRIYESILRQGNRNVEKLRETWLNFEFFFFLVVGGGARVGEVYFDDIKLILYIFKINFL